MHRGCTSSRLQTQAQKMPDQARSEAQETLIHPSQEATATATRTSVRRVVVPSGPVVHNRQRDEALAIIVDMYSRHQVIDPTRNLPHGPLRFSKQCEAEGCEANQSDAKPSGALQSEARRSGTERCEAMRSGAMRSDAKPRPPPSARRPPKLCEILSGNRGRPNNKTN